MDQTAAFEAERPRLRGLAARILGDPIEAEDIVQQAWLRLDRTDASIEELPAWLTTVTSRLCLDRLRKRTPVPAAAVDEVGPGDSVDLSPDPVEDVLLAEAVGAALHLVLDRLNPRERVAFVLHDSFGVDFDTIASVLDTSPEAARKLASRARAKVRLPPDENSAASSAVVDAFLAAAREGDFTRLLELLAPDAVIVGDPAAVLVGTPAEIRGQREVATFFNGAAAAALPVTIADRPGAAWFHRGEPRVAFDFTVTDGVVARIDFRADPAVLALIGRRTDTTRP
ncbi:sigma-70 family RNA polymerase sigma factor [Nocardioides salsibiostraticola]